MVSFLTFSDMVSDANPLLFNKTTGTLQLSIIPLLLVVLMVVVMLLMLLLRFLSIWGRLLSVLFPLFVRFWWFKMPFLFRVTACFDASSLGSTRLSCLTPDLLPPPGFLSGPVFTCFFSSTLMSRFLTPISRTTTASLMTCLVELVQALVVRLPWRWGSCGETWRWGEERLGGDVRLTCRELLFRAAFASASSFNLLACGGNISDNNDITVKVMQYFR